MGYITHRESRQVYVIPALKSWTQLRKLTLHWPLVDTYWDCPHLEARQHSTDPSMCRICDSTMIPYLDWFTPFVLDKHRRRVNLRYLRDNTLEDDEVDLLEDAIRECLRLPANAVLDELDSDLLFHAWEARHYPLVSKVVRAMADVNPYLEQYEWIIYDSFEGHIQTLRWSWRIMRTAHGAIKDVIGDLAWSGCTKGDPAPFLPLVGQELEYTLHDASGRWDPVDTYCYD